MPVTSQLFPFSVTSGPPESPFIFEILWVITIWKNGHEQNLEIEPNLAGVDPSRHEPGANHLGSHASRVGRWRVARRPRDDLNVGLEFSKKMTECGQTYQVHQF